MNDLKYLSELFTEIYRFQHAFVSMVDKLDVSERPKYAGQYSWFSKKVKKAMDEANIKLVVYDGEVYSPGMAVMPINIDEFGKDDVLVVSHTIEPTMMHEGVIIKTGMAILGKRR